MMRYAVKQIIIDPEDPVRMAGHIQQVDPVAAVHDHLHARILALDDGEQLFIHISCDILGVSRSLQEELTEKLRGKFHEPLQLTVSATHNHYAGDPKVERYYDQLRRQLYAALLTLEFQPSRQIRVSYALEPYQGIGTSRISHHQAQVLLGMVRFWDEDREFACMVYHNCHPTVLSAVDTQAFSAEYPGWLLQQLAQDHPGVFFTFLQGPAGDVSTRFTRRDQTYDSVIALADKLKGEIETLAQAPSDARPLQLSWQSTVVPYQHEFNEIHFESIPDDLTDRELETIRYGQQMRAQLKDHPEHLARDGMISAVALNDQLKLVFAPNELFSGWLDCIDTAHALLVCYSNGYSPYVTPPHTQIITYETFTDTLTEDTKQRIADVLRRYGGK
jgi:hypothetical protein